MRTKFSPVSLALSAIFLLTLPALAEVAPTFEKFEDKNESAFSVDAPKNWAMQSAVVRRYSAGMPVLWLSASTADHKSQIEMGDPSIPKYVLPGGIGGPPIGPSGPAVLPYQTGQQYAASYVQKLVPPGSTDVHVEESKDEPELTARAMSNLGPSPSATISVGSARCAYTLNGEHKVTGCYVTTMIIPGPLNTWSVLNVWKYHAAAADASALLLTLQHMRSSFRTSQQWTATQMNNFNQQAAQWQNVMDQQRRQSAAMLKTQADANQAALNAAHQRTMDNLSAIGERSREQAAAQADWHNNQMVNHYAQMAVKDNNNYHEVLMIQNRHLEWSPTLQRNVEVPN